MNKDLHGSKAIKDLKKQSLCLSSEDRKVWLFYLDKCKIQGDCLILTTKAIDIKTKNRSVCLNHLAAQLIRMPIDKFIFKTCLNRLCLNPNHFTNDSKYKRPHLLPSVPKTQVISRFKSNIIGVTDDGCHIYKGAYRNGYGIFYMNVLQKKIYAHRAAWMLFRGDLPPDLVVRHLCHNPKCVNIKHLRTGTKKDNTHDMMKAGRDRKSRRLAGTIYKNTRKMRCCLACAQCSKSVLKTRNWIENTKNLNVFCSKRCAHRFYYPQRASKLHAGRWPS